MKIFEKSTIRYKLLNGRRVPLCDYEGTCRNKAHREIFPLLLKSRRQRKRGWSYLCRKHFEQEAKRFKGKLPYCTLD